MADTNDFLITLNAVVILVMFDNSNHLQQGQYVAYT